MAGKSVVAGLTVTIGADNTKFLQAIREIDRSARTIADDLKTVNERLKLDPTSTELLATKLNLLNAAAKVAADKVDVIKQAINDLNKQAAEGKVDMNDYTKTMEDLGTRLQSAEQKLGLATQRVADFTKETNKGGTSIDQATARISDFNTKMQELDNEAKVIAQDLAKVNQSLKIDPGDAAAAAEKMKLLEDAVKNATQKVDLIKEAMKKLNDEYKDKSSDEYKKQMADLERQLESATNEQNLAINALDEYQRESSKVAEKVAVLSDKEKEAAANAEAFTKKMSAIKTEADGLSQNLKIVNERLKLDPNNVELVEQKIKLLVQASINASEKVNAIKNEIDKLNHAYSDKSSEEYKNRLADLNAQLKIAENEYGLAKDRLNAYSNEVDNSSGAVDKLEKEQKETNKEVKGMKEATDEAGKGALSLSDIIKGNLISDAIKSGLKSVANAIKGIADAVWNAVKKISKSIWDLTKDSVKIAEENKQTLAKVKQVFGENAQAIIDWSHQAVDAFGLTSGKAQSAAATFGNMFLALGITSDQAADMSMNMVQLAADVAAFNNVTTEEVLADFQSMLAGTSRQVRKYGIVLTEAAVKEKAVAMGLAETTKEVTDADKAIARYALMVEQTTHQEGQFGRESNSVTVLLQKLRARVDELKGALGEKLEPVFVRLLQLVNQILSNPAFLEFIESVIEKVGALAESFLKLISSLDFTDLEGSWNTLLSQIVDKLMEVLPSVIEFGTSLITSLLEGINKNLPLILAEAAVIIQTILVGLIENLPSIAQGALNILTTLIEALEANLHLLAPLALNLVKQLVNFIVENAPGLLVAAFQLVIDLADYIAEYIPELLPTAVKLVCDLADMIIDQAPELWRAAKGLVLSLGDGLIDSTPDLLERLPSIITGLVNFFLDAEGDLVQVGYTLLTSLVKNLPDILEALLVAVGQIVSGVVGAFRDHIPTFKDLGVEIITGIWQGIQDMGEWFKNNFKSWIVGILQKIPLINQIPGLQDAIEEDLNSGEDAFNTAAAMALRSGGSRSARSLWIPSSGISGYGGLSASTVNNTNTSSTVGDVNIYVNSYGMDVATVAEELGEAFQKKIRMSGAML